MASLGAFLLLLTLADVALAENTTPLSFHGLPLLFADDGGIQTRTSVVRTAHPGRTRSNPVLEATEPWEGSRTYMYGSVYQDSASGEFRMWYASRPSNSVAPGATRSRKGEVPGLRNSGADLVLYATSADGLSWKKPELRLHAFAGSPENNIIFDLKSPSVLLDLRETDPAKRYKMLGCTGSNYHAAYSADGQSWHSYPHSAVLKYDDTITLTQDPATGEYLAYHKCPATIRGYARRVVWLSRSRDFQTWSPAELVFAPDEADDDWVSRPNERTEVYDMAVFPHAAGYIGFPAIFRVMADRPRNELQAEQSPLDGPIDIQLATSTDGTSWHRSWPRIAMIPRGSPGTFDAGAILGTSSTLVNVANQTWVFYTALTTTHGGPIPEKRIAIGRAEWRLHGFASLDAGPQGGSIQTIAIQFTKPDLVVNADAAKGNLSVELQETDGRPIPGFALADCTELKKDDTAWKVQWKSALPVPNDRPMRVAIQMQNTCLYSLSERDSR